MKTPKKIYTTILIILLASCSSLFAFGYNVNFEMDAGLSNCLLGKQIQENKFVWDDFGNIPDYITAGGAITADLVLTQEFSVVGGIRFKNVQLNYLTSDGVEFGNGVIHLQYPVLQIPLMAKYSFAIHKTTEVIDSLDISAGVNISCILGDQTYKDSLTTDNRKFISPFVNVGVIARAAFAHRIGPGKAFAGLQADFDCIPQGYAIDGRAVNFGNVLSVSPFIGYTFILKEDKGLAKITEKNKRIKDIDVNNITPVQALTILQDLKREVEDK